MKIRISLSVKQEHVLDDFIEIDDYKLEELTEEEKEGAIEVFIRGWLNNAIQIEWETEEAKEEEEEVDK